MPIPTDAGRSGRTPPAQIHVRPRAGGVPGDLGRPVLPRSKSHAQRALVVGGLGAGELRITHLPEADDVVVMRAAVTALGARVRDESEGQVVVLASATPPGGEVECGDNGTALRTLLAVVGLLGGRGTFTASERLRERPLAAACSLLASLGVEVSPTWPLQMKPNPTMRLPARLLVDAATTTQPASGALLGMACRARRGLPTVPVEVVGARAAGYLALTVEVLEVLGFDIAVSGTEYRVAVPSRSPDEYDVPIDASAVAFPAALAALHGHAEVGAFVGKDTPRDRHPDWDVLEDLRRIQAASDGGTLEFGDLGTRPDTFPALCVAAAARAGTTILRGAPALRGKESDRIAAMATGLRPLGVGCDELPDGLVVRGRTRFDADGGGPVLLPAPPDHRVVMALALLGTRCAAGVAIPHAGAVRKSWPGYFAWLARVATVAPTAS